MRVALGYGWSLIELLLVLAVLGVVLGLALPEIWTVIERRRLYAAADAVVQTLQFARQAASRLGERVYVRFDATGGMRWRASVTTLPSCSPPPASPPCLLRQLDGQAFPGVIIESTSFSDNTADFDPVRALADNGRVFLADRQGGRLEVVLSSVGRVRLCVPAGSSAIPFATVARC